MIQLIIAFIISLGFHLSSNDNTVSFTQQDGQNYGIVITDDVGTKTSMTLIYDTATNTFKVKQ